MGNAAVGLTEILAGDHSLFVFSGPGLSPVLTTGTHGLCAPFVFPRTTDFRRPALVRVSGQILPKSFAPSKGTQSCLEIRTQTTVAKLTQRARKGQHIHDYVQKRLLERRTGGFWGFLADENCTRKMSTNRTKVPAGTETCRCRPISQEKSDFRRNGDAQVGFIS
jgi:hypothetical protein